MANSVSRPQFPDLQMEERIAWVVSKSLGTETMVGIVLLSPGVSTDFSYLL